MVPGNKNIERQQPEVRGIHVVVVCFLVFLAYTSHLNADEPFAPWAKFTGGGEAASQQKTPTSSEVGIPAYPNAYIISVVSMGDKSTGKKVYVVHLVSADAPETIKAFYQEKLPEMKGWKYDEIFESFYTGDDYTTAMSQFRPYMEIMEVSLSAEDLKAVDPTFKQTLKGRIQIAYNPK
jgi:hypothetical protein